MSHWNYRVMKRNIQGITVYGIHEVYYDYNGKPNGYTAEPVSGYKESKKDLKTSLKNMLKGFDKYTLNYESEKHDNIIPYSYTKNSHIL